MGCLSRVLFVCLGVCLVHTDWVSICLLIATLHYLGCKGSFKSQPPRHPKPFQTQAKDPSDYSNPEPHKPILCSVGKKYNWGNLGDPLRLKGLGFRDFRVYKALELLGYRVEELIQEAVTPTL